MQPRRHEDTNTDRRARLDGLMTRRILVLDGAMGTMIQREKLTEAEFRGERFRDHPKESEGQQRPAGADAAGSDRQDPSPVPRGRQRHHRNEHLQQHVARPVGLRARVARLRAERRGRPPRACRLRRVDGPDAGQTAICRGRHRARRAGRSRFRPTLTTRGSARRRSTSCAGRTSKRSAGLIDGGVDLLMVETVFDTLNAKAALVAIQEVFEATLPDPGTRPPVMISVTVTDRSGRTLSGQTVDAFWVSIANVRPFSVGINCALGARDMRPYLAELARIADCYISCHPNAGLPNAFGLYDEQPDETAAYLREFAESGFVDIVGGCCGTTPEHIAAIAKAVRRSSASKSSPRRTRRTRRSRRTKRSRRQDPQCPPCPLWWRAKRSTRSSPASKRSRSAPTRTFR